MRNKEIENVLQEVHTFYARRTPARFLYLWGTLDRPSDMNFVDQWINESPHNKREYHQADKIYDKLEEGIYAFWSYADYSNRRRFCEVLKMEKLWTDITKDNFRYFNINTVEDACTVNDIKLSDRDKQRILNLYNYHYG